MSRKKPTDNQIKRYRVHRKLLKEEVLDNKRQIDSSIKKLLDRAAEHRRTISELRSALDAEPGMPIGGSIGKTTLVAARHASSERCRGIQQQLRDVKKSIKEGKLQTEEVDRQICDLDSQRKFTRKSRFEAQQTIVVLQDKKLVIQKSLQKLTERECELEDLVKSENAKLESLKEALRTLESIEKLEELASKCERDASTLEQESNTYATKLESDYGEIKESELIALVEDFLEAEKKTRERKKKTNQTRAKRNVAKLEAELLKLEKSISNRTDPAREKELREIRQKNKKLGDTYYRLRLRRERFVERYNLRNPGHPMRYGEYERFFAGVPSLHSLCQEIDGCAQELKAGGQRQLRLERSERELKELIAKKLAIEKALSKQLQILGGAIRRSSSPPRIDVDDWKDAETLAVKYMKWLGFHDAVATGAGSDEGKDVDSTKAVAQVKDMGTGVPRPMVQQLFGVAIAERKIPVFFARSYASTAVVWAEKNKIALFRFNRKGNVEPVSKRATELIRNGA